MQVQKGLVKYKDRSDILCTYGITDDGKTYYFLEENVIPNGNIVATTVLVEAIDPLVLCSSIGVIDPNGKVIIPFENKAIKTIANDLLLVEKATPVTESVIEAIELRSDPQSASRLVTTPAVIKENINAKMGAEGRFVFNDQFSEATICDVNGNNLVNNELYSFVGLTQDKLYLSKNTPESFVSEFSLETKQLVLTPEMGDPMLNIGTGDASEFTVDLDTVQQNGIQVAQDAEMATAAAMNGAEVAMQEDEAMRNAPAEQPVENAPVASEAVDEQAPQSTEVVAQNVEVNQGAIAPAVEAPATTANAESGFMPGDITAETFAEVAAATEMTMVDNNSTSGEETSVKTEEQVDEAAPVTVDGAGEVENQEAQTEESKEEVTEETSQEEPQAEDVVQEEVTPEALGTDVQVISSEEVAEAVEPVVEETKEEFKLDFADEKVENVETTTTDLFSEEVDGGVTDSSLDINVRDDDLDDYSSEYDLGYLPGHVSKDNLVQEVTATVNELVKLNKSQKQRILMFEEKIEQLTEANKKLTERAREQSKDFEKLRANVENYRTVVGKLEAKNGVLEARNDALESKCRDQERTIYRLNDENKSLRAQNINNEALAQVLAEARSFIGNDSDYDEDVHYYRKAA